MDDDGWINPDNSAKRQRISNDSKNVASGSKGPVTEQGESSVESSTSRESCQFGSKCYRRNEAHLLQYRHRLLEEAYSLMMGANDFTKFPRSLSREDADESIIIKQAVILRDAGFQVASSSSGQGNIQSRRHEEEANHSKHPTPSSSQQQTPASKQEDPWKDSVNSIMEERRRKYLEKKKGAQQAVEKKREEVSTGGESKKRVSTSTKTLRNMAEKWEASCPFNVFLTKVRDVPTEKEGVLSANFTDLFDPSLGEVKALCHINFMVEANWLFDQTIKAGIGEKPTWVIYGDESAELKEGAKAFPWLKLFSIKSPFPFGHHHTKMSFVQYTDHSVRFLIYTANLVESDWDNRTQGIWISPRCPKVPSGSPPSLGESVTNFRADILQYLSTYPVQASAAWKDVIKSIDCSAIKVYFIGSVPITAQSNLTGFQFGIKKMEKVLRSFEMETEPNWPLTIQCSSIGTLGACADDWVINEFGAALAGKDRCIRGSVNVVYPSDQNVKGSFDGVFGGACLPYSARTHMKQKWLVRHLRQWKADRSGRSRAPPHIKSYFRSSPDYSKLSWFLLTSANLSKAAWGKLNKNRDRLSIMSWEAGVLFVPEILCSSTYFKTEDNASTDILKFPMYLDIPLEKYEKNDIPWFFEQLQLALSEQD